jgi:hypothetical protein
MYVHDVIREVYVALSVPAESYAEVISRIYAQTGVLVRYSQVCSAFSIVRHAPPEVFGWTVPPCKRGRPSPGRLIRVLLSSNGGMILTPGENIAVNDGNIGTLGYVSTILETVHNLMDAISTQLPTLAMQRLGHSLARDAKYMGEKVYEMREDCRLAV